MPYPGVAEHHREVVNLPLGTVGTGVATLRPVALRHLAGFGFVPDLGEDGDRRPDLAEVVPEDGRSAVISLFVDLFKETDSAQAWKLRQPLLDIWLVGIQFAGFAAPTGRLGRTGRSEVVPHGFAIESGLAGEFADVDPSGCQFLFTSEILEHEVVLRVDHVASTRYSVVPDGAMLFRPNWGILFRRKWGILHRRNWGFLFRR